MIVTTMPRSSRRSIIAAAVGSLNAVNAHLRNHKLATGHEGDDTVNACPA